MVNYEPPQMKYPEQKGLVSIIVPIYNTNEIHLRECLGSILAQTFTNWETILVDDGSTDSTVKIVDEYAKKDSRFIAVHKPNEGTLLARKTGLENSKGEFVANIDHDDKYHPRFLEKMYAKIIETNSDFVWCKIEVTDINEKDKHYGLYKIMYSITDCEWTANAAENVVIMLAISQGTKGMNWVTWNKLIKREIYAKVCFPQVHLTIGEDPVQMLQVAYHSKSAAFVPENLYFFRATGISSRPNSSSHIIAAIWIRKTLGYLFDGIVPNNIMNIFNNIGWETVHNYFYLDKKTRTQFKDEIKSLLPEVIKTEKRLNLKICLFLAGKGIEFPFKLRERIRKWIKRRSRVFSVRKQN